MKAKKLLKKSSGFTLIEILVVMMILVIFASIVGPRILGKPEEAKRAAAAVQIQNIEGSLDLFKLDNGFYPSTEQGLDALIKKPTVGKIPKKFAEGGYMKGGKIPPDPWGNPYIYLSPGVNNKEYDLESYGADGEDGGEDKDADIESWNLG